ncbi:hypothetical protein SAMN04487820_110196 [Actinopolyspora mzabensis]|uniref:Uncharacterized protein n=1 Tax=Actinopolyspora mzabensis TaxID=995066 RepID=A0A1G9DN14_ACTMZ|nr:hypothetical protein SAMN04487820_110196 [Actinopolyspora mzabensis]
MSHAGTYLVVAAGTAVVLLRLGGRHGSHDPVAVRPRLGARETETGPERARRGLRSTRTLGAVAARHIPTLTGGFGPRKHLPGRVAHGMADPNAVHDLGPLRAELPRLAVASVRRQFLAKSPGPRCGAESHHDRSGNSHHPRSRTDRGFSRATLARTPETLCSTYPMSPDPQREPCERFRQVRARDNHGVDFVPGHRFGSAGHTRSANPRAYSQARTPSASGRKTTSIATSISPAAGSPNGM